MLFVTFIQSLAVGFTVTSLVKNTLMLSPEQEGVTCNITTQIAKRNITAEHLVVYWGWRTLQVRWNFQGLTDTQIWFQETYEKTFDTRCNHHSHINFTTTHLPTVLQSIPIPTPAPTIPLPAPPLNITAPSPATVSRKLLQYESYSEDGDLMSFEVPLSLQYNSALTTRSFLPSLFYALPPLQSIDTYGHTRVEYAYPFKLTKIYEPEQDTNPMEIPTKAPTKSPTNKKGCDDLEIVIQTGKSYFSLLVCGLLCESITLVLLIPPTCHLVTIKSRRLIKQIVIGVNTVGFMLLLMAVAVWFAYFSTNINQVIEAESNADVSVCILGEPVFGDSIAYLLTGWLLIGFATMSVCYLSNRPKRWYRFVRQKRNGKTMRSKLDVNEPILEESPSDSDSEYDDEDDDDRYDRLEAEDSDSSEENERLHTLVNRTPSDNSSGSNDTYMTADGSLVHSTMKGDTYTISYSPP